MDLLVRAIPWLLAALCASIYHLATGGVWGDLANPIVLALIGVICAQLGGGIAEGVREGMRKRAAGGR